MKRGEEQEPVSPSPEEAQRVNAIKGPFKKPGILSKALDVATGLTLLGVGGLGLKSATEHAPQKPAQTTPDQRGPNLPPQEITFPEGVRGDSSAPSTFRVLLPQVTKKYQEAPLRFLREFGNLETDKVLFINKGEKAWVEMGDEELYQNLLKIRDEYSFHPDLKRRIYFYESLKQLQDTSGVPYDYPNNAQVWPWDAWARRTSVYNENEEFVGIREYPRTFGPGEIRWQTTPDGTIEFHLSLPEPLPSILPAPEQIAFANVVASDERLPLLKFLFSGPAGPYKGMGDKYNQAINTGLEPQRTPLIKVISKHRHDYRFPVKLVYKEPPSK